jgi:chorismate mutase/prephenate dehydratase
MSKVRRTSTLPKARIRLPRKNKTTSENDAEIASLRQEINRIDADILQFLNQRAKVVIAIGKAKASRNLDFYSPSREREIYERLCAENRGPFPNEAVRSVFREILSASLSLEKPLKVSFLGPRGTFTHLACMEHFGRSCQFMPERNLRDVFDAVERKRANFGLIPIENSTEGLIAHTLDLFMDFDVRISAEIFDVESTARAAELASSELHSAAIASGFAGKLHDLNVPERRIQEGPFNDTRFLVIGKNDAERTGRDKTSLVFYTKDRVGALHEALKPFAENRVSVTRIESRPHKKKARESIFFLDIQGYRTDENIRKALREFDKICSEVKLLGSYPQGRGQKTGN